MKRDFTLGIYGELLDELIAAEYNCMTFQDYMQASDGRIVILRHDVDSWPINAKQMAEIEARRDIKATYYFRKSPLSYNEKVLDSIIAFGHEIGYHYEDLSACNGDKQKAIKRFEKNLSFYRQYYPVKTIAMHGRPLSKWDGKKLWEEYDYRDYGLIGEPYLDIDFEEMLYLTDTGNRWDGDKYSVRDYVKNSFQFDISSTFDLIDHIKKGLLPDKIMLNIHPARWNDNYIKWWVRYYILTLPKYQAKKTLKKIRAKKNERS